MPKDSLGEQVARVLEKLERVRERRIATFGADSHRYALAAPLGEAEVLGLEAQRGIALPESYRAFLTRVGASGAGPYYGILPPSRWVDVLYGDVSMPDWAARPCVWTAGMRPDNALWKRVSADLDEPFQGVIAIAEQGCAHYAALVVTGAERGRVVYLSLDGGVPYFPENDDFLSWYERWLDELGWGHRHMWFGTGMPGDEATLAAAARHANGPRRLDALQAMHRLPALAPATAAIVATRARDDEAAVRAAALALCAKFALAPAIDSHVRRAAADVEPAVRREALRALKAGGGNWHDEALRALDDNDDQVAMLALRSLAEAKVLPEDALLELLARPPGAVRTAAIYAARDMPSARLSEALLPLARAEGDDSHAVAVLSVIMQVRSGGATAVQRAAALELLLERLARPVGQAGRTAEIHGLGAFVPEEPRALKALIELTRDPDAFVRFDAALALGNVGGAEAIDALRALVSDEAMPRATTPSGTRSTAWSVGHTARRALAKIEARVGGSKLR